MLWSNVDFFPRLPVAFFVLAIMVKRISGVTIQLFFNTDPYSWISVFLAIIARSDQSVLSNYGILSVLCSLECRGKIWLQFRKLLVIH